MSNTHLTYQFKFWNESFYTNPEATALKVTLDDDVCDVLLYRESFFFFIKTLFSTYSFYISYLRLHYINAYRIHFYLHCIQGTYFLSVLAFSGSRTHDLAVSTLSDSTDHLLSVLIDEKITFYYLFIIVCWFITKGIKDFFKMAFCSFFFFFLFWARHLAEDHTLSHWDTVQWSRKTATYNDSSGLKKKLHTLISLNFTSLGLLCVPQSYYCCLWWYLSSIVCFYIVFCC